MSTSAPLNVSYEVSTINQKLLLSLVIKQHFGNSASKIIDFICKRGGAIFADLKVEFPEIGVKSILCMLLRHQCVSYSQTHPINYRVDASQVLHRLRFPLYMEIMDDLYGLEAVKILEQFCENGTYKGHGKTWDSMLMHHFIVELQDRYFDNRQSHIDAATSNLTLLATQKDKLNALKLYEPPTKKRKLETVFILNFSRFDVELRNEYILKTVTLNRQATLVLKAILDVSASHLKNCYDVGGVASPDHISKKITPDESKLYDAVHSSGFNHDEKVIAYIDLLCFHGYLYKSSFGQGLQEPEITNKVIQAQSSEENDQFLVPYKHLTNELQQSVIDSSIRMRLGERALRVYKAMRRLKNADEKMIANEAMLPSSEARQLLYALSMSPGMSTYGGNEGGIIGGYAVLDIVPIFKSAERNPIRGHYIYKVKTEEQLKKDILDSLYKFEFNILTRLLEEERKHRIIEMRLSRGDIQLGDAAQKLVTNYQKLRKRLWDSLLLTDQLVAIFRDFK